MINDVLGRLLNEMADMLEISGDNPFRIRAFRRGSDALHGVSKDVTRLSREEILAIPGIGKGIADIIDEFRKNGVVREHEKLSKIIPAGVLAMTRLPGLGPKKAAFLFKEMKIDSIEALAKAARDGRIAGVRGFGVKTQESILKNIAFSAQSARRLIITEALAIAEKVLEHLRSSPVIEHVEIAGSARRWKETVGDLDFIAVSRFPEKAIDTFLSLPEKARELASGESKASIVLKNGLQCDFRVVPKASFGAALLYFTGSKEHNVRLREIAQKRELTLNEYGLFRISDRNQKKPLAGKTEEEVYRKLGLAWIPPELREDRGEIDAARENRLPDLIEEKDVRGDFHNHTLLSDGVNTASEMADAARKKGWEWIFIGDHSPSLKIASGLSVDALRVKMKEIKKLDDPKGFRVMCGSEVDILKDGSMDYPDDVLNDLGCVVAAVHTRFSQSEAEMTARLCRAVRHPGVDILGHVSGRRLLRREPYALNYGEILAAAKTSGTAMEINGQPERQDMADAHVRHAIQLGVPLVLNTDAHSTRELDNMTLAVHIARRGWAERHDVLNTQPFDEILKWLR